MLVQVRAPAGIGVVVDVSKYSTAERLFRVTAWLVRFIFNLQAKNKRVDKRRGELSVGELVAAENLWIQEAQTELDTI